MIHHPYLWNKLDVASYIFFEGKIEVWITSLDIKPITNSKSSSGYSTMRFTS